MKKSTHSGTETAADSSGNESSKRHTRRNQSTMMEPVQNPEGIVNSRNDPAKAEARKIAAQQRYARGNSFSVQSRKNSTASNLQRPILPKSNDKEQYPSTFDEEEDPLPRTTTTFQKRQLPSPDPDTSQK